MTDRVTWRELPRIAGPLRNPRRRCFQPPWAAWFGGLHVETDGTQTVISGLLTDQPALHGLLARIRDLGLCLISVRRLPGSEAGNQAQPSDRGPPGDR